MNCTKIIVLMSCILCIPSAVDALIVGSDVALSRNTFFTFPCTDDDNEIRGFAVMNEGFALEDNTTTCTFNGFFPVREQIFLNNSFLTLETDMQLENVPTFTNLGNIRSINGEVRSLVLADNTKTLGISTQDPVTFENIDLVLKNNITLDGTINFTNRCRIGGNGYALALSDNANIIVNTDTQLELDGVIITGIQGNNIRCADDSAQLLLTSMNWIQADDVTFDTGAITFQDKVSFGNTFTFCYESAYTSTILSNSTWKLTDGIHLRTGRHAVSQAEPLAFEDQTSVLNFDNVDFSITNSGMQFTKGKVKFSRIVSFEFESTSTSNGVVIGSGDAADDFIIEFTPASVVNFIKGHFTYNNSITDGIRSRSQTAQLVRSTDSNVFVAQNLALSDLSFINNSLSVVTPVVDTGKTLTFKNLNFERPNGVFSITSQLFSSVALLLRGGDDQIFITKGSFPFGSVVQSTGSTISGTGSIDASVVLSGASTQLNWANLGTLNALISLNGGTLTLDADLAVVGSGGVNGPGTIDLNGKTAFYGINDIMQTTPLTFLGGGAIKFNSKETLSASILFQDHTIIEGLNNILVFSSGELVVDSGATLVLKDMILEQVSGEAIRCVDDTGVIILNNAQIVLSDTFTFTHGALQFLNKNTIQGNFSFIYETPITSTVFADSYLKLDPGVTFSYDPPSIEGNNKLLQFVDSSAQLILNGATFITTSSGIELTNGTLDVKHDSNIGSDQDLSIGFERGVAFGDGTNDLNITIRPEVALTVNSGLLEYRNLNSSSLSMASPLSSITIGTGATLQLYQNLPTGSGRIVFENLARLLRTSSTNVIGTIEPRGALQRGRFTP